MKIFTVLIVFFTIFYPIHNSNGAIVNQIDKQVFQHPSDGAAKMGDVQFNADGTKMFTSFSNTIFGANRGTDDVINEYTLSTPYDISTATYAGNGERCAFQDTNTTVSTSLSFRFSDNGMKIFVAQRGKNNGANSYINRLDLTTAYDVSTCSYHSDVNIDTNALQNGTNAGNRSTGNNNNLQGMTITNDGTKLFVTMNERDGDQYIKEYSFATPYDLSTLTIATTAIVLQAENPFGLSFSNDGKKLFQSFIGVESNGGDDTGIVEQYTLTRAYDLSSATLDGQINLETIDSDQNDLINVSFNNDGSKMFSVNREGETIFEYNLPCSFVIIQGKCPSISENKDRSGMIIAQMEIAKRTIDHSTDTALNRIKWIRRNKDEQNLTNLNLDINFTNQKLKSLTEIIRTSSSNNKKKDKENEIFYWSEGTIAIGRIGDTSISSTKTIETDAITFGADKLTKNNGIKGLAFRLGRNNVDVGNNGSNLDGDTYNITFYSTSPIEDDSKFVDTVIGIGKLRSDLLTVVDGNHLTADRNGDQLYGSLKIKDEIKKDNLTFIPSGRIDIGHTILRSYKESGIGAIEARKQHVNSKKIRAGLVAVEDLSYESFKLKRYGKLEYIADIDRSSNFKYNYVEDTSTTFNTRFHSGALHNLNGEIGIDLVFTNNFSLFLIYERKQSLGSGYEDKIHIATGYLPNKETNFAFTVNGSENLSSKLEFKKNVNGLDLRMNMSDDLLNFGDSRDVKITLNKVF